MKRLTFVCVALGFGCAKNVGIHVDPAGPEGGADAINDAAPDASAEADVGPETVDAPAFCNLRCGPEGLCCADGEECATDQCLGMCDGARCGDHDELCCTGEELCLGGACVPMGDMCSSDDDCEGDDICESLIGRCISIPVDAECRFLPPEGEFAPAIEWEWLGGPSHATPLVIQTNDDNGDGAINRSDVPDVIFSTDTHSGKGTLMAFSGDDGRILWETDPDVNPLCSQTTPAAADVDGDGDVEIAALQGIESGCAPGGWGLRAVLFDHEGVAVWTSTADDEEDLPVYPFGVTTGAVIADLDSDGFGEVLIGGNVFAHDGTALWWHPAFRSIGTIGYNMPTIADLDEDGFMEVIESGLVLKHDGTVLWNMRAEGGGAGYTAVGHVVGDGTDLPQIVSVNGTTLTVRDGLTGTALIGPLVYETVPIVGTPGAGPPTIADFDNDGSPEVGVAGDHRYWVFDFDLPPPYVLWTVESEDSSTGSVGSTVFDFEGDGAAEVVYADECHLKILSGKDGEILWHTPHMNPTYFEYPVVADVDGDGNAEIVVVSEGDPDAFAPYCEGRSLPWTPLEQGIRVYGDTLDHWVATRTTWNEHSFHLDNIDDDMRLPATEPASWKSHNTYRANYEPNATLSPDLVIVALHASPDTCPAAVTLRARVQNSGSRGVGAGLRVAFFAGEPGAEDAALLGVGLTTGILLPGAGEWVEIEANDVDLDDDHMFSFHAIADDDGEGRGLHGECHEDNNASETALVVDCSLM